jgi:capsular exopolysaccharide synthesis family protein
MQNNKHNTPSPDYLPDAQAPLDLREFGRTLIRHKHMILLVMGITVLLALLFTLFGKPVYLATATLQIERESSKTLNLGFMGSDDIRDPRDFYQTQFELIRSRIVLERVITDLQLEEQLIANASLLQRIKRWFSTPDETRDITRLENMLLENVTVEPVKNSRLVAISYTADTPEEAAQFANAIANAFKAINAERRLANITETAQLIEKSVLDTKTKLDEAQQRLNQFFHDQKVVDGMDFNTLQQEVSSNKTLYQDLLQRKKEIGIAEGVMSNNVSIIDPAQVPLKQYKPQLSTNLPLGALLGLLLGISAAFMREFLDDTAKDVAKLEHETQLPVLGIIPDSSETAPSILGNMPIRSPRSSVAEAFRTLRTALHFLQRDKQPQAAGILLITSANASEGKSTAASNLACTYAHAGNRVLIIDADLRKPSLHKTLDIQASTGLADYLSGKQNDPNKLILPTDIDNLYMIPAGHLPDDPAELLSSVRMQTLLATARKEFDQIILDAPPVLGLADALVLASLSSSTLVTVRAGKTRMGSLKNALKRLRQSQAPVAGLLLNRAEMGKSSSYGYGYADYHYQADDRETSPVPGNVVLSALNSAKLLYNELLSRVK